MRVLVTGGTGVVGVAAVNGLLARGHSVRLLCRHADRDVAQWSRNVQPFVGDITNASITGSADDCDAVLHLAGIIEETPPERTYERVNVHGTRNTVKEAARARVKSFVYVSSLGAQRGRSAYHRSKFDGETMVTGFPGEWRIVRLGNVYGPGDTVVSVLLRTIRIVPIVPTIDGGRVEFQPIWHQDAGEALAAIVEGRGGTCPIVEVAGPDRTSMADLLDHFGELTGRRPPRMPVPAFLADTAVRAAEAAGVKLPLKAASLTMLLEHNVIEDPSLNALPRLLDHPPTPLHLGLTELVDAQPEQTPADGTGPLKWRRIWVDIRRSKYQLDALFNRFLTKFDDFVRIRAEVEPRGDSAVKRNKTLTLALPLRGNVQVRVEQCARRTVTLITLAGHPLAGAVHFRFSSRKGDVIRFEVEVFDRPATIIDRALIGIVGGVAQRATWMNTASRVVAVSGGQPKDRIHHEAASLNDDEEEDVEAWLQRLINRRKREEENA